MSVAAVIVMGVIFWIVGVAVICAFFHGARPPKDFGEDELGRHIDVDQFTSWILAMFIVLLPLLSGCVLNYKGIHLPHGVVEIPEHTTNNVVTVSDIYVEISGGGIGKLGVNK